MQARIYVATTREINISPLLKLSHLCGADAEEVQAAILDESPETCTGCGRTLAFCCCGPRAYAGRNDRRAYCTCAADPDDCDVCLERREVADALDATFPEIELTSDELEAVDAELAAELYGADFAEVAA